jgi:hypothetical protein
MNVALAVRDREPLVPVTVRVNVPSVAEVHVTVAVPEPVTIPGVIAPHVSPEGTVSVRETVAVNPFKGAIVIVETTEAPALTAAGDVTLIVKSGDTVTVQLTVAECEWEPLAPVTVTVNELAAEAVHDRVEAPDVVVLVSETLAGLSVQVSPVDGEIAVVKATVPTNPLVAATVMVEVPDEPTAMLTAVGLAVKVKLGTAIIV